MLVVVPRRLFFFSLSLLGFLESPDLLLFSLSISRSLPFLDPRRSRIARVYSMTRSKIEHSRWGTDDEHRRLSARTLTDTLTTPGYHTLLTAIDLTDPPVLPDTLRRRLYTAPAPSLVYRAGAPFLARGPLVTMIHWSVPFVIADDRTAPRHHASVHSRAHPPSSRHRRHVTPRVRM